MHDNVDVCVMMLLLDFGLDAVEGEGLLRENGNCFIFNQI